MAGSRQQELLSSAPDPTWMPAHMHKVCTTRLLGVQGEAVGQGLRGASSDGSKETTRTSEPWRLQGCQELTCKRPVSLRQVSGSCLSGACRVEPVSKGWGGNSRGWL